MDKIGLGIEVFKREREEGAYLSLLNQRIPQGSLSKVALVSMPWRHALTCLMTHTHTNTHADMHIIFVMILK